MEIKLVKTGDGSHSLYVPGLDEYYHSTHGALRESLHVFIEKGFEYFIQSSAKRPVKIFELGFGTGLNALLMFLASGNENISVEYTGMEMSPLSREMVNKLNYSKLIESEKDAGLLFEKLHLCPWGETCSLSPFFTLYKVRGDIHTEHIPGKFNIVFFDAFGPKIQPLLWEEKVLKKMWDILEPGGVLVTYCAQGKMKRNLRNIGFEVQALPGPPGKREMTRAVKPDH